ncbi:hypothetical protein [Polaribacter sp. Asnod6-C07]|uniref:hypothetical protein n=1 Tax=Polaribacter sp. Asnod6-C07 TaxID=3160582 RepID=UPI003863594F
MNLKLKKNKLEIGNKLYDFFNYSNDSIKLFNFLENKKDITLVKFIYNNFDMNDLKNTCWKIEKDSSKFYKFFDKENTVHNFLLEKNNTSTEVLSSNKYTGNFFNKFHFFSDFLPYTVVSCDNNSITLIYLHSSGGNAKYFLKKINKNPIDSLLIGKWRNTNKYKIKKQELNLLEKISNYQVINYKSNKFDSIKKSFDYSQIIISKDSLTRIFNNGSFSDPSYFLFYNSKTKILFLDNQNKKPQFLNFKEISKDTILVKISDPSLLYEYSKVNKKS